MDNPNATNTSALLSEASAPRYAASIEQLHAVGFLDFGSRDSPQPSEKQGYVFTLHTSDDGQSYEVLAHPIRRGETGTRSFYMADDGAIRYSTSNDIGPESPQLGS